MRRLRKIRVAALVAALIGVAACFFLLPVRQLGLDFLKWVQRLGPWGPVILALAYTPACLLLVPGSVLTLGSGFAFGVVRGSIAASLGSILGATVAFIVGRTLARDLIEDQLAGNPRFRAIDHAVGEQGAKIVLLTRLSPVLPFSVLNYAFGLTKISLRDYVLASSVGMLPGTVVFVYFGSAIKDLADLAAGKVEGGWSQTALLFVGLLSTLAITIMITRIAHKALVKAVPEAADLDANADSEATQF